MISDWLRTQVFRRNKAANQLVLDLVGRRIDANSRSNGLDAGETRIFKSPSLKNIAVGGPYMHDGRFTTLEQVVEHYNSGVQVGPALDNRLRAGQGARRLNLSQADKDALVAFMRTLDDSTLLTDTRFSNPFK